MSNIPILLIVDDDPELLDMYSEFLQIDGVETVVANSAHTAFEFCKNNSRVQIILSDANMGEVSGLDLLANLRSYYETIPVFYLLTGAFEINQEEVKKLGAKGIILKPFDLSEILERIKKDIKF